MKMAKSLLILIALTVNTFWDLSQANEISQGHHYYVSKPQTIRNSLKRNVRNVGALEDEEDGGGDGSNPGDISQSTSFENCRNSRCCYQFTWPGYIDEAQLPSPSNATCQYLRQDRKDDQMSMACFDPLVFTSRVSGDGNPPNVSMLQELAIRNDWSIYCPLTQDKTCLTLKYYSRGGDKQVVNETRFCGNILESQSGSRRTSGCFSESVSGYTREVCACETSFCNSSMSRLKNSILPIIMLYAIFILAVV